MIMFERTATIEPGKISAAIPAAHKIAAHIRHVCGVEFRVLIPIGGDPLRIRWRAEVDGLSAVETLQGKLLQDRTYLALTEEIGACLTTIQDDFWRSV